MYEAFYSKILIKVNTILLILLSFSTLSSAKQGVEDPIEFNKQDISEEILWPIHTIFQDHEGRMLFSGMNYLWSYDGNQIDTISLRNINGDVFITGILESCNAHLAISTTKGLYIIDPRSKGTGSNEPVLEGCMNVMLAQDEEHLWLGTNQGLLNYSYSNGLIKKLTLKDGLPSDVVHGLLIDADSALWISTWNGMAILPADEALPAEIKHYNSVLFGQMAEDSRGLIWAGGESEIIILDKDQRLVGTLPSEINSKTLPPTYIPWQVLLCDSRGWIWHAVPDNLFVYDPGSGTQRSCNLDFNLRIEQPTALFEDKDGSIWLATTLGNIYRYDLDLFPYQSLSTLPCPFPMASILSVAPVQSDNVAIATSEGLYMATTEFDNFRLILRNAVTGLCIDSEYRIWVTTNDELVGLELDERSLQTHEFLRESLPDISVSGLQVDGSDCWISTFDRGIFNLNIESGEFTNFLYHPGDPLSLSSNHITSMILYGEKLWLGSVEGKINMIDPLTNRIEEFNTGSGTSSMIWGMINHFFKVNDELWIATNNGIGRIDNTGDNPQNLLEHMEVNQIQYFGGFMWISHAKGMDIYDLLNDRLYHVIGPSGTKDFKYLFCGPDQYIYLINDTEIRRYSHLLPELNESSTIISQSKINNVIYPLHSGSKLAYDENNLEILLSVLSYRNRELNRYAVYLEGEDVAWQESNSPVFSYQNLKPGTYNLHYKGANFTGKWSQETEIPFAILPSPWLTKWAMAGYILVLVLIAFIFFSLQRRNKGLARDLQSKSEELKEFRKNFQEELLNNLTIEKIKGRSLESEDIQLLRKVVDFIDTHLADDGFSVENIAQALSMSRTKLFRQMKLITGVSPTEFIISYRLKLAAEMLKKKTGNISEIALSVGYKNPAHFSDSFRKLYGCSPSEFSNSSACNEKKSI